MILHLPEGVEWYEWRLTTDKRIGNPSPPALDGWSFMDGVNAHAVLDELDRVESEQRK